jgi:hypothetical protein
MLNVHWMAEGEFIEVEESIGADEYDVIPTPSI